MTDVCGINITLVQPTPVTIVQSGLGDRGPVGPPATSQIFTFGVDEGWDFGEGWFDFLAPEGPPSTANRAVVTPDTITLYVSAIASQAGVDQTAILDASPTITLPVEFLVDPLSASGPLDYFTVLSDSTGQHVYFGQGVAFFEPVDVVGDPWSIYIGDSVFPEVLTDEITGEVVNSADLFAFGTDIIFDNIQVFLYGTVIRNLGPL